MEVDMTSLPKVVRDWAVDKPTTEKLESALNDVSDCGRTVFHLEFTGGRDWVVVSFRDNAIEE
jgi:hypothetical protein